jgi:hypothetical protein
MLSTNFLIDYSEKNTQITIGYFNNKVDIFLPKSNGGVYLLNPKNIRFTEIGSVLVKKTKEINTRLYKTFKRTDDFTEILKDLKGVKSIVYDINIENWIKLNKSIIKDGGYNVIENTFALENTLERKLPISRQLTQGNSCKSDNYYDYLLFIIDYLSNSNNYEYIYLYRNVDYPVNYVYEITPTYRIYAYLRNVNMFDISGIYGDAITGEYYFTEYKGYCQDGSIQYRYFPVRIDAINPPVVLPDIGTEYVDYSESINKTIVDNIVALFTKLDIITQIMNFTRNPFYKIRTDTLTNLGLNYFQQIKEHLDYDKSLIDYMFLYWTTLLKPTFISSDIVVS